MTWIIDFGLVRHTLYIYDIRAGIAIDIEPDHLTCMTNTQGLHSHCYRCVIDDDLVLTSDLNAWEDGVWVYGCIPPSIV